MFYSVHALKATRRRYSRTIPFLILIVTCVSSSLALAEGSAQLDSLQAIKDYSKARSLRAEEASLLYVDILKAGEIIHLSLCGKTNPDKQSVQILDPFNNPVFDSGDMDANIDCESSHDAVSDKSISYETKIPGTFSLRLENHDEWQFQRLDVSIAENAYSAPDYNYSRGRLWSYSWNLNSNSFSEARSTHVAFYALVPGGRTNSDYIWKLDFNNFADWEYDIAANDIGVHASGSGYSTPQEGHSVRYSYPLYLGVPAIAKQKPTRAPIISSVRFIDNEYEDYSIGDL